MKKVKKLADKVHKGWKEEARMEAEAGKEIGQWRQAESCRDQRDRALTSDLSPCAVSVRRSHRGVRRPTPQAQRALRIRLQDTAGEVGKGQRTASEATLAANTHNGNNSRSLPAVVRDGVAAVNIVEQNQDHRIVSG